MDIKSINRFVQNGFLPSHTLGLMGNHGIGKTSYVHKTLRSIIAKKHGIPEERVHVVSRCVSIMDPADLIGNFQEFGGRTYNCPPSWIPTCKAYDDEMEKLYNENGMHYSRLTKYDDIYVLFLDECKRGNAVIQDAIMELLLEHRLFGVDLKEDTYVVCADNENAKIYNGTRRDPAQESRIKNFTFAPTDKEYLEDFKRREDDKQIHRMIHKFLSKYPEFIVLPTKTIEELAIQGKKGPSPRDWTQLGECLRKFQDNGDDIVQEKAFLTDVASSYVGFAYALKFADFCSVASKQDINVVDILDNFDETIDKTLKDLFAKSPKDAVPLSNSLLDLVKKSTLSDVQNRNILAFLECCPSEAVASFIKAWQKENKAQFFAWRVTPRRFAVYNKALLNKVRKNGEMSAYEAWIKNFTEQNNITESDMDRDDLIISV